MFRVRFSLSVLLALCLILLFAGSSHAQIYPGRITGIVLDSSGGAIEGAQVALSSAEIGLERSVTTDSTGVFHFSELPLGTFRIAVTKEGFKTFVQTNIVTSLTQVNTFNVTLTPGTIETQVEVSSAAPILETQTDTVGGDISSEDITQLPMGNSDYTRFGYLLPGTSTNTAYTFTQIAINGSPSRSVSFNIDGSINMDAYRGLPAVGQGGNSFTAATRLPPDAISEMNVISAGAADSEAGAGSMNVVLKSGSNDFHGSVYEQHRDASLTAHNFFENLAGIPKAHFIWNEWGGSFGGPIRKDKTFFFVGYDGGKSVLGSSTLAFAPNAADIATATTTLAGVGITTPNALGTTILNLYQPHSGQFVVSGVGSQSPEGFSVKIDQKLGNSDQLTGRYLFGNGKDIFPQGSDSPTGGSQLGAYYGTTPIRPQNIAVSEVHTFSTQMTNVFRVAYNRVRLNFVSADSTFNPSSIGLDTGAAPTDYGLPEIDLGAGIYENLGINTGWPKGRTSETFQWNDDLAYNHGKHSFQFGANWQLNKIWGYNDSNFRGLLTFDGSQEGNALIQSTDPAGYVKDGRVETLIDLLAGLPDPSDTDINRGGTRFDIHQNVVGLYATDTYQLTRKLTVIAGLRWDLYGVPQEDKDRFSNFSPAQGLFQVNGNVYNSKFTNFAPRVALAYSPFTFHGLHTVVRAGYGIYYVDSSLDVLVGEVFNLTNSNPGLATNPINGRGVFPNGLANPGTPIEPNVPIFTSALTPTSIVNLIGVNPNLKPPYVQSWNLNLEQELAPAVVLQVGYVASKGTHLYSLPDINQPLANAANYNNPAASANEQAARPFFSQYPQYGQIGQISSIDNSTYNSLQVMLKTKNFHGFTSQLAYTWSHDIDEASETMDFFGTSGFVPRDSYDPRLNHGSSEFDVPQSLAYTYIYQFKDFTKSRGLGLLVNAWQVSGVVTWHDSMPLPVLTYDDISGTGELHDVPDCTGPIVMQYKNFTIPAVVSGYSEPNPGTYGNCARNSMPGPWLTEWDASFSKWFQITEKMKLQFRADGFNFLNHANFGDPASSLGAETVSGTADAVNNDSHFGGGAQRQFQFNLKLVF